MRDHQPLDRIVELVERGDGEQRAEVRLERLGEAEAEELEGVVGDGAGSEPLAVVAGDARAAHDAALERMPAVLSRDDGRLAVEALGTLIK